MRVYNPKNWFTNKTLFYFNQSDSLRIIWPYILLILIFSSLVAYAEKEILHLSESSWVKNINILHTTLSFVISLLLVFRTNTAYDRWWEGRKLWGQLVNVSRNLAITLNAILPETDKDNRIYFQNIIPLYAKTLKEHLQLEQTRLSLDENHHDDLFKVDHKKHLPNQILLLMTKKTNDLYSKNVITGDHLINITKDLSKFSDICGGCERIKNTPIPFSYSVFIKRFIIFYIATMPFTFTFPLGYATGFVVAFIFYVLSTLELIAEEIEDPFGVDENDLPTDKIAKNIDLHINEIFDIK